MNGGDSVKEAWKEIKKPGLAEKLSAKKKWFASLKKIKLRQAVALLFVIVVVSVIISVIVVITAIVLIEPALGHNHNITDDIQELSNTVETLQTSKADQSDLDELENTVTYLGQTAASKTELNSLSERLTNHITSSQNEHNRLTSRIDDNDQEIQSLVYRISVVEGYVQALKDTAMRPTESWMITAMATIITFMYIYMYM